MKVDIIDMPAMRVAAVPHRGAYSGIAAAFGKLGEIGGRAGLFGPDTVMLGVYHDDPRSTPEADLRSAAGVVVADGRAIPAGLDEVRLPAGKFARTTHVGPYDKLPSAWNQLMTEWFPSSGRKTGKGTALEIYRNAPGQVPDDQLITEIYIPVE